MATNGCNCLNYFCCGGFLIFLGSILLCSLGFTIVLPHEATKNWPDVACRVLNTSYSTDQCSCEYHAEESGCVRYPCLQIKVLFSRDYDTGVGNSSNWGFFSEFGQAIVYRSWNDIFYGKCALHECGDAEWNIKETRSFENRYGRLGQTYRCFLNPETADTVIITRMPFDAMLHSLLWPSLFLMGGVTLWLGLCLGCWRLHVEPEEDDLRRVERV